MSAIRKILSTGVKAGSHSAASTAGVSAGDRLESASSRRGRRRRWRRWRLSVRVKRLIKESWQVEAATVTQI